jgi:hypothetical protein
MRAKSLLLPSSLICVAALASAQAVAQGPRIKQPATLEELRACPRNECLLTLETGTLDGTRMRVGQPGELWRVGFSGYRVTQQLSIVPAAAAESQSGRRHLWRGVAIGVSTLATIGGLMMFSETYNEKSIAPRMLFYTSLGTAGVYLWQREMNAAERHLESATQLYNRELPP